MRTYLQAHDLWNVVENDTEPSPLRANPTIAQIRQHSEKSTKKHKALACLQNGVSEVIFTKIMACNSPKQAREKLKEEFMGSDKTRQQQLINLRRDFENLKMKESETIRQYSDRIMATVNSIKLLGEDFRESRVVEKVVTTLPENKGGPIGKKSILKELSKERKKKAQVQVRKGRNIGSIKGRNQEGMEAGKDFHYAFTAKGVHIWRNTVGIDQTSSAEAANNLVMLRRCVRTKEGTRIDNGDLIEVKGKDNVVINTCLDNKVISDVLYVPDIDQNLLSVGQLVKKGYSLVFKNGFCIVEDTYGQELVTVAMTDRSFMLDLNQLEKKAYTSLVDNNSLWHRRLGHVNFRSLNLLHKLNLVDDISKIEAKDTICEVCQLGKQTRLTFPANMAWRARNKLELVYSDVCGPMKTPSLNDS
ncbi:uncharacterized protein LOC128279399 [Gossypium arboreum]|uniref:uncharacterized protein LOC128279399 n=1 Tax=Gossypium arboreum TaxID=29729 RepID=UPI0022F1609C|nr:uncharacterized protein LOC128279399 [Gossypium arboreum]